MTATPAPAIRTDLDLLAVNTIRTLAMDAVEQANSGHPGTPMALAPLAWALYTRHLRHSPEHPLWPDRDRFVLSAGHASMLLYATLYLTGYAVTLDDLRAFRQWGSPTAGHPEHGLAPGVETTTGPLGQGLANAVGMAMAEAHLAARFNRPGHRIVDHRTWVVAGDGDLMEGVSHEAASFAGHLGLSKLTLFFDDNHITIEGATDLSCRDDAARRFEAYGWHVQRVADINDLAALDAAIDAAVAERTRPSLIVVRSHIGYGAPTKHDTAAAHGSPLGADEIAGAKAAYGWPGIEPFFVPDDALALGRRCVARGGTAQAEWRGRMDAYRRAHPREHAAFESALAGNLPDGWERALPSFAGEPAMATRQASGRVLNALARVVPTLIGGSADLAGSTNTLLKGETSLAADSYAGRNLHFGIREHAMAGVMNGMALHGGVRPYGATFLVFADYLRPALRLAALMEQPVIYVFTHDSIGLGEDGPTHQPVEHLASLRAIPNVVVLRPADAPETAMAWRVALTHRHGPVALVLSRQTVPLIDRTTCASAEGALRGAYVLADAAQGRPRVVLIATGSEVALCLAARVLLEARGTPTRVVSMPSQELFAQQDPGYRDTVLPPDIPARIAVEAASPFGWHRWVGDGGVVVGIARFGASAPAERLFAEYGFTPEHVAERARALIS